MNASTSPSRTRSPATSSAYDADQRRRSTLKTIRRPRVRGRAHRQHLRRVVAQPGRGLHRRDRPDARHARPRAASSSPTASSTRRAATTSSRPSTSSSSAAAAASSCFERRTGGCSRSASSATSTSTRSSAGRARSTSATTARRSDLDGDKIDGHAAGDRHDLAPGLRLRHGLPDDRRGPLPRGRREGHASTCATHTALGRRRPRTSSTGTTPSTRKPAARERKILASEFGDDYDAIPAYEQIYALAGPTQTYRITGDPRIRSDIERTLELFDQLLPRPRGRAATSRTSTRSRSTRARESLGAQPARGRTGTRSATTRPRT